MHRHLFERFTHRHTPHKHTHTLSLSLSICPSLPLSMNAPLHLSTSVSVPADVMPILDEDAVSTPRSKDEVHTAEQRTGEREILRPNRRET